MKKNKHFLEVQNKEAFTLVEVLNYIAVMSLFAFFLFDFCLTAREQIETVLSNLNSTTQFSLALDLFRRDLMSATMHAKQWDLEAKVFRKQFINENKICIEKDICWKIKSNKLIRIEGKYDYLAKKWLKKITSTAAYNVNSLEIGVEQSYAKNRIKAVLFKINYSGKEIKEYLPLRNRILVCSEA